MTENTRGFTVYDQERLESWMSTDETQREGILTETATNKTNLLKDRPTDLLHVLVTSDRVQTAEHTAKHRLQKSGLQLQPYHWRDSARHGPKHTSFVGAPPAANTRTKKRATI